MTLIKHNLLSPPFVCVFSAGHYPVVTLQISTSNESVSPSFVLFCCLVIYKTSPPNMHFLFLYLVYVDLSDWSAHLQCLDDIGVSLTLYVAKKMSDILHLAPTTGQSASDLPLKSPPPYLRRAVHSTVMYSTVQVTIMFLWHSLIRWEQHSALSPAPTFVRITYSLWFKDQWASSYIVPLSFKLIEKWPIGIKVNRVPSKNWQDVQASLLHNRIYS